MEADHERDWMEPRADLWWLLYLAVTLLLVLITVALARAEEPTPTPIRLRIDPQFGTSNNSAPTPRLSKRQVIDVPLLPTPWSECRRIANSVTGQVVEHRARVQWRQAPTPPEIVDEQLLLPFACMFVPAGMATPPRASETPTPEAGEGTTL